MEKCRMTRRGLLTATAATAGVAALGSGTFTSPASAAATLAPPAGTVRVFWLKPRDVAFDQRYPDGIAGVMRESQRYYRQELGVTFTINNPVVEVVEGEHERAWYENTPSGNSQYWWVVFNMQQELLRRFGLRALDSRWLCVGEISAEKEGVSGGGGGSGWVILSGHDADGAAGINGPMNRWYGGMVHELGHAFGLPDSSFTDGTPMSACSTTTRTATSTSNRRTASGTADTAASSINWKFQRAVRSARVRADHGRADRGGGGRRSEDVLQLLPQQGRRPVRRGAAQLRRAGRRDRAALA